MRAATTTSTAGGKGMDGHSCVHEYGIPNFYFHSTMTYAPCCARLVDPASGITCGLNLQ